MAEAYAKGTTGAARTTGATDSTDSADSTNTTLPLTLEAVSVSVGTSVLVRDLSMQVSPGERVIVLGPNGAGKSTCLRLMHGLAEPSAGRVLWAGRAPCARLRRRQGFVFQSPVLLRRSVRGNLSHALASLGRDAPARAARRARVEEVLALVGLEGAARQAAHTLSGGERQLLSFGRVLIRSPEVLFLDEPTAHLDPGHTARLEALAAAAGARGLALVFVTHDPRQAERLGGRVCFLDHGRLAAEGEARHFFANPPAAAEAYLAGRLEAAT